jgi:hypothetical protein
LKTACRRLKQRLVYTESGTPPLDGLHIFHNPFAERPLAAEVLGHDRVAQFFVGPDGLRTIEPDDFLLMRMIRTLRFTE